MATVRCSPRAVLQLFLTGFTIITAIVAFAFAFLFERYVEELSENFRGEIKGDNPKLPCIRSTLSECPINEVDKCWDYCCPAGYQCKRDPVVSLYCEDVASGPCGDEEWCKLFADIPSVCHTETCKVHDMVKRITKVCYVLAATGIVLDLMDVIAIIMLPDLVICKGATNILASLAKWVAFALSMGAGTDKFLDELSEARCYNGEGQNLVGDARNMFFSYVIVQVISACLSMVLAPFSAYYGGKLQGVPYVK